MRFCVLHELDVLTPLDCGTLLLEYSAKTPEAIMESSRTWLWVLWLQHSEETPGTFLVLQMETWSWLRLLNC